MKHRELREALEIIDEEQPSGVLATIVAARYIAKAIVIAGVMIALALRGRGRGGSILGGDE